MSDHSPSQCESFQPPVGIDLGTTLSVVAYLDATGRPTTLPNRSGDLLTPSALAFEDDCVIVGKEAIKGSVITPEAFADCFKRDMGRGVYHRAVGGQEVPPEVFNAFLLERLKQDAEQRLGPIRQAVITVPAFFDERRRKATQDAGRLAGLDVLDIINEPTAAAVAYGYHTAILAAAPRRKGQRPERLLVYDLGGGTFDVTILEIDGGTFRTVATDGDVLLGGKDFDRRLVDYVAENFLAEHQSDPRDDPHDAAQLWIDVQEAKHTLSQRRKTTIVCSHRGRRMRQEITRETFESLTLDLLGRTQTTTSLVLRQAGLQWDDIDRVLLIGGSTRMPMVADMLRSATGKEPDQSQSADEAVAHGAALYAAMLMHRKPAAGSPNLRLINVNSHSLGVVGVDPKTGRRLTVTLIPKNTPLPATHSKRFQTARANQPSVRVAVVEGESPRPEHCIPLGKCVIRDLPKGLPKGTRINVQYEYATNGRLSVSAQIPSTGQSTGVEIERKVSEELDNLDRWRRRLCPALRTGEDEVQPADASKSLESSPPHGPERTVLLKQLDEMVIRVGTQAVRGPVIEWLEETRQAARDTAEAMHEAEKNLQRVEATYEATVDRIEKTQIAAMVAKARLDVQNARAKARFALLDLGRECVDARFAPHGLESLLDEIERLQQRVKSEG
ncbi:MAG: Hsp70 family protein [Pirellulales bacterium]|nr:Hsp70 family protein [Pirellulales bacterium]